MGFIFIFEAHQNVKICSPYHFHGCINIWEFLSIKVEVSHVSLPMVVKQEVPAGPILVVVVPAHDALDVPLDMGMRNPSAGWNVNLQYEE